MKHRDLINKLSKTADDLSTSASADKYTRTAQSQGRANAEALHQTQYSPKLQKVPGWGHMVGISLPGGDGASTHEDLTDLVGSEPPDYHWPEEEGDVHDSIWYPKSLQRATEIGQLLSSRYPHAHVSVDSVKDLQNVRRGLGPSWDDAERLHRWCNDSSHRH